MSNSIRVGNVSVDANDLRKLSCIEKIYLLHAMFEDGLSTDSQGQIIQNTDLMYTNNERTHIGPFATTPNPGEYEIDVDPYEEENEPVSSDFEPVDESPDTVRLPFGNVTNLLIDNGVVKGAERIHEMIMTGKISRQDIPSLTSCNPNVIEYWKQAYQYGSDPLDV